MVWKMISITLRCKAPRRLVGEYTFSSFRELYLWLLRNFKDPSFANHVIIPVAEHGEYRSSTHRRDIEITSSSALDYRAKEIARGIGLLRQVIGGDRYSRDEKKGLAFVESVDEILSV